jgi:hypothetical protein
MYFHFYQKRLYAYYRIPVSHDLSHEGSLTLDNFLIIMLEQLLLKRFKKSDRCGLVSIFSGRNPVHSVPVIDEQLHDREWLLGSRPVEHLLLDREVANPEILSENIPDKEHQQYR